MRASSPVRCTKTGTVTPLSAPNWIGTDWPYTSRLPLVSLPVTWSVPTAFWSSDPRSTLEAGRDAVASVCFAPAESTESTSNLAGTGGRENVSVSPPVTSCSVPLSDDEQAKVEAAIPASTRRRDTHRFYTRRARDAKAEKRGRAP